jgi:putative tryptophan/tyrosine transport system substrate-binding protein
MMHGSGTSDSAIVAVKPANKVARPAAEQSAVERTAAEPVERRAETKGNADRQSTHRTLSRAGVSQALERIRQTFAVGTRGRSRMRESCTYGSVRGALSNERPYRNRREFITLLGGAAASWPLAARAQQARKVWRIGFLAGATRPVQLGSSAYAGFLRGMRELGHVEGRDFVMEWRFAEGRPELYSELAAELLRLNVDVIVLGTQTALPALRQATTTIPIVMGTSTDPVGMGYVASLARPGGNITGLAGSSDDTTPKQLELLLRAAPKVTRVGILVNPETPTHPAILKIAQASAESAGRALVPVEMRNPDDLANAFAMLANERAGALMVPGSAYFFSQRQRIAEFALKAGLPTIFIQREYVEAGGLMSYGESIADFYRRAAFYVDKIFKGAKPADLPVQQPTRFFLTINRKTAETLGLTIPLELLVLADEIIE